MNIFIKEWADHSATLMTDNGQVLSTYPSRKAAYAVCREYYAAQFGQDIEAHNAASGDDPLADLIVC